MGFIASIILYVRVLIPYQFNSIKNYNYQNNYWMFIDILNIIEIILYIKNNENDEIQFVPIRLCVNVNSYF